MLLSTAEDAWSGVCFPDTRWHHNAVNWGPDKSSQTSIASPLITRRRCLRSELVQPCLGQGYTYIAHAAGRVLIMVHTLLKMRVGRPSNSDRIFLLLWNISSHGQPLSHLSAIALCAWIVE